MIKVVAIVALAMGVTVAVIESSRSEPIAVPTGPIAHVEPWELHPAPAEASAPASVLLCIALVHLVVMFER